jgi:hypothetical protein
MADDPLSSALAPYRSAHREVTWNGERVCGSDHHRWPCDASILLDAVEAALTLHARPEKPTRCWDLDLRCPVHREIIAPVPTYTAVRDCPDCTYRERFYCTRCDHEEWPCPTVRAITAKLTGEAR